MTRDQLISHAKEQEKKVQEVLKQMAEATNELDVVIDDNYCTSAFIEYDEQDVFNSFIIFNSIASNYAIKHGIITKDNVIEKMNYFREALKSVYGIDTIEETQNSLFIANVKNSIGGIV